MEVEQGDGDGAIVVQYVVPAEQRGLKAESAAGAVVPAHHQHRPGGGSEFSAAAASRGQR